MATPYTPRSAQISRSFTDSEKALDERIDQHLQAPPIADIYSGNSAQSLAWMREEMKTRSIMTSQLAQEQQLADRQSIRHELADQVVEQDADDAAALEGMRKRNALIEKGVRYNDAVAQVTAENEGLALNPRWNAISAEGAKFAEGDDERELREANHELNMLKVGTQKFDLEAAERMRTENPDLMDRIIGVKMKELETQGITAANEGVYAQIVQLQRQREHDKIKATNAEWTTAAANLSDDPVERMKQFDQMAPLVYSFEQNGLGGVNDPAGLVKRFGGSTAIMGLLQNKDFLAARLMDPAAKEGFTNALNTLNSDDPGVDPVERNKAMGLVLGLAGDHSRHIASSKEYDERLTALNEISQDRAKIYKDVSEDMSKILASDTKPGIGVVSKTDQLGQAAMAFIDQFRIQGAPGDANTPMDDFAMRVREITGNDPTTKSPRDPARVAKELREEMGAFARKYKESQASSVGGKPKPGSGVPVTRGIAQEFLRRAGGDKDKARQMASDAGYSF